MTFRKLNKPYKLFIFRKVKKGPKKRDEKEDPLLEEAARTIQEAERMEKEKKRIEAYRSQLEANETASNASGQRFVVKKVHKRNLQKRNVPIKFPIF